MSSTNREVIRLIGSVQRASTARGCSITSGPAPSLWRHSLIRDLNFVLTTRATFGQAMKIAGGSSWKICWRSLTAVLTSPSDVVRPQAFQDLDRRPCSPALRIWLGGVERVVRPGERSAARSLDEHARQTVPRSMRFTSSLTGRAPRSACRRRSRTAVSAGRARSSRIAGLFGRQSDI